eukprot:3821722-Rhodomonas_salina.1
MARATQPRTDSGGSSICNTKRDRSLPVHPSLLKRILQRSFLTQGATLAGSRLPTALETA